MVVWCRVLINHQLNASERLTTTQTTMLLSNIVPTDYSLLTTSNIRFPGCFIEFACVRNPLLVCKRWVASRLVVVRVHFLQTMASWFQNCNIHNRCDIFGHYVFLHVHHHLFTKSVSFALCQISFLSTHQLFSPQPSMKARTVGHTF